MRGQKSLAEVLSPERMFIDSTIIQEKEYQKFHHSLKLSSARLQDIHQVNITRYHENNNIHFHFLQFSFCLFLRYF